MIYAEYDDYGKCVHIEEVEESAMTDEQRVKAKWPDAYCRYVLAENNFLGWQIVLTKQLVLDKYFRPVSSIQPNASAAWADAAKRIEGCAE